MLMGTAGLKKILIAPVALWSAIVFVSLFWNLSLIEEHFSGIIAEKAKTLFQIIMTTRLWNTSHGGVYVPVAGETKPNPYMPEEERAVTTSGGMRLAKINHAHMTRQMSETMGGGDSVSFHITSRNPLRPDNQADPWESAALESFEKGAKERLEFVREDGKSRYRYMAPLFVEGACLHCHAAQGYRVGDIRGGISIALPSGSLRGAIGSGRRIITALHMLVLAAGLAAITAFQLRSARAADALARSERRFQDVTVNTGDWVWEVDSDGRYTYSSPAVKGALGYEPEEVRGRLLYDFLHSEDRESIEPSLRGLFSRGEPFRMFLNTQECKDGGKVILETSGVPVPGEGGGLAGYRGVHSDVTEQKHFEEELRASIREKETLLREINHRVKNNMQIISSLLRLHQAYIKDPADAEIFKECQGRIMTMAYAHEKLYQSDNLAQIKVGSFLKDLAGSVLRAYRVDVSKITLRMDIEDMVFGLETAVPCGMLMTELISNSLKHAFCDGREGIIEVSLSRKYGGELELVVKDNGPGMPPDTDITKTESLGLKLVSTLAEGQLEGSLDVSSEQGAEFRIRFRELDYSSRIKD
jgi:PAS domain S-box-containing protein